MLLIISTTKHIPFKNKFIQASLLFVAHLESSTWLGTKNVFSSLIFQVSPQTGSAVMHDLSIIKCLMGLFIWWFTEPEHFTIKFN